MSAQLLPPDVAQGLTSAVNRAASDALRCRTTPGGTADEQMHRKLKQELRPCIEEALSNMSSAFNAETTLPGRLWNELWCIVWSFLPMAALVRATHVCCRWRNVALGCAQLWCWVEYESNVHYDDCTCHLDRFSVDRPRCEVGPGSSNLSAVQMFLSRSGTALPISLGITMFGEYGNLGELQLFTTALEPYVHRLAMIRFTSSRNREAFSHFLERFDCFPMLRVLQGSCNYLSNAPRKTAGFLSRPIRLPVLRRLQLIGPLESRGIMPGELPVLEFLGVGGSRMEPQDVLEYLKVAPALRQLRIQSPIWKPREQPPAILAQAHDLAAGRCMSVDIGGLSTGRDAPFLAVFGDGARHRRICLVYTEGQGDSAAVDGARILGHLERVAELAVYYRRNAQLVVEARAPDDRERALEFQPRPGPGGAGDVQIGAVWTHLRAPPDTLRVDARAWVALRLPAQVRAGVKKLDLEFDYSAADLDALALASPGTFPLLEELTLSGDVLNSTGNIPRVAAATVLRFLQAVAVPGVVKGLVLNRVEVTGDRAWLESAVQNVVVQSA